MDGVSVEVTMPGQTVEFTGHLIDSLTLSKVADQIQARGGHYRLNDIRIGTLKKDISAVNMTLFAENEQKLKDLIADMAHYGAQPSGNVNVEVMPCPADATLPEEAFSLLLPGRVLYEGRWLNLNSGKAMAIAIFPENNEARLMPVAELKQGTLVVSGTQGVEW